MLDGLVEDAQLDFVLAAAVATAEITPTWYAGDDLQVEIPSTASVSRVFAVLTAKSSGFNGNPDGRVRF